MVPDEQLAYAVAAWSRFNAEVSDDLLRALSGAFALVASADGELATSEVDGFVQLLRDKASVFSNVDFDALEGSFRELTDALIANPDDGRLRALDCVAGVRGDATKSELVRSAAAIALAADGRVRAPEEAAVKEIHRVLGLDGA
ncbi:MAG: TerB family tellurite resistance protein [Myxococcota bacterium]